MNVELMDKHPELAMFFERMTFLPLEKITPMVPMGGSGIGMHVIPVEKAISLENETADIEHFPTGSNATKATWPSVSALAATAAKSWTKAAPTTTATGASAWAIWPSIWWKHIVAILLLTMRPWPSSRRPKTMVSCTR